MSDKERREGLSKRQARREELRRRQRQQRIIVIASALVIVAVVVGLIIVPTIQATQNPGGKITPITPKTYSTADGTRLGNPEAKVKVEVFEDFKCSACRYYTKNVEPQVIANLAESGQILYIHHQYPFLDDASTIKDSDRAALAALCAAAQNRYWEYKDLVFENMQGIAGEFNDDRLFAFARALKLDLDEFKACYLERRFQSQIDADLALGQQMGVQGTPSVFVNGVNISPGKVPTYQQILQAVQAALSQ